jgi:hypothetical protein
MNRVSKQGRLQPVAAQPMPGGSTSPKAMPILAEGAVLIIWRHSRTRSQRARRSRSTCCIQRLCDLRPGISIKNAAMAAKRTAQKNASRAKAKASRRAAKSERRTSPSKLKGLACPIAGIGGSAGTVTQFAVENGHGVCHCVASLTLIDMDGNSDRGSSKNRNAIRGEKMK